MLDNQNELKQLVDNHVYCNVSMLIAELANNDKYMDDLQDLLSMPDPDNEGEYIEALEFWIVSDWFANQLEKHSELVHYDFYGLTIWGRTTSGQAIHMDYVIEEIFNSTR